ncbi:NAD(P)H nitroreductase [Pseudocolwellia agarivorans]|uniref:NAD(P)H nitroreductase n=1 Tax=Pseudocolwellia agarivorans TaxID=1911682 RepID=UPI000984212C|nr:NAD(P)H nitroreductase [Pseudocolwellia agarivorans]
MNSLELLLNRQSNPHLCEPAPVGDDLHHILSAGMRVPDHGCLTPWHFTVIQGEGLNTLSQHFVNAVKIDTDDAAKIEKTSKMPFRAPMIIVVSTQYKEHKVPQQEQLVAAGCSVHAMQMMAYSLGFGAVWRTGELSYNNSVKYALNINRQDDIVGFLYIGTEKKQLPTKPVKPYESHVTYLS